MSRDVRVRIEDAIAAAEEAIAIVGHMDLAAFLADRKSYLSTERLLFVLGEALARLPPEVRDAHPEIAWRDAIGLRNYLAHGYFSVDPAIVRRTVLEDLPTLVAQLRAIQLE